MSEIAETIRKREAALVQLEERVKYLSDQKNHLQKRINALEKVPLPAIEYFLAITEGSEKRSKRRDYFLFALGVIVSALVSFLLRQLGLG